MIFAIWVVFVSGTIPTNLATGQALNQFSHQLAFWSLNTTSWAFATWINQSGAPRKPKLTTSLSILESTYRRKQLVESPNHSGIVLKSWGDQNVVALCDLGHSTKVGEQMIMHVRGERYHHVCGIPLDEPDRVPNAKSVRKCVGNTNLENVKSEENKRMHIKTSSGPFCDMKTVLLAAQALGSSLGQKVLASSPPFVPHQRPLCTLAAITFISTRRRGECF